MFDLCLKRRIFNVVSFGDWALWLWVELLQDFDGVIPHILYIVYMYFLDVNLKPQNSMT